MISVSPLDSRSFAGRINKRIDIITCSYARARLFMRGHSRLLKFLRNLCGLVASLDGIEGVKAYNDPSIKS